MESKGRRWQSLTVGAVGLALLIPSAVVAWFGRDVSVVLAVSAGMVLASVILDRVPTRWFEQVQQLEVSAGGNSVKLGFRELSEAASAIEEAKHDIASPEPKVSDDTERVLARLNQALRDISTAARRGILPAFRTRYASSATDHFRARSTNSQGVLEDTHRAGSVLLVTVAGNLANEAASYELHGVMTRPDGVEQDIDLGISPLEANPPDNWFNISLTIANLADGNYKVDWYLRSDSGDDLLIRHDTFAIPTPVPWVAGSENQRI